MLWEVRVQYANGRERVLRTYKSQETALRYIDAIYSQGYPLHLAFVAHPISSLEDTHR